MQQKIHSLVSCTHPKMRVQHFSCQVPEHDGHKTLDPPSGVCLVGKIKDDVCLRSNIAKSSLKYLELCRRGPTHAQQTEVSLQAELLHIGCGIHVLHPRPPGVGPGSGAGLGPSDPGKNFSDPSSPAEIKTLSFATPFFVSPVGLSCKPKLDTVRLASFGFGAQQAMIQHQLPCAETPSSVKLTQLVPL